jgi:glutathione peroxidase-family protein
MPEYDRTKALYAQVKDVIQAERTATHQAAMRQFIDEAENAFLDIALTDDNGITQSLADLRGKVIILDFSAIEMEQSKGYIFELRELYNQYHNRGLAIYSVSLDRNKLLWEDGVVNLPWTNVYAGEQAIEVLTRYNVQSLPTLFLLDRKGNVQGRYTDFKQLDTDIRKYL